MASMESFGKADEYRFDGAVEDIKPSPNKVLVRWIPQFETRSGILIPLTEDLPYVKGRVVSKGEKCLDVEVDDVVWIEKYSPHQRITIDGDLYAILMEQDIVAVVEEDE